MTHPRRCRCLQFDIGTRSSCRHLHVRRSRSGTCAALWADHSMDAMCCMAAGDIGGASPLAVPCSGIGSDPMLDSEPCRHTCTF